MKKIFILLFLGTCIICCGQKNNHSDTNSNTKGVKDAIIGNWHLDSVRGEYNEIIPIDDLFPQIQFTSTKQIFTNPNEGSEREYYYTLNDSTIKDDYGNIDIIQKVSETELIILQKLAQYGPNGKFSNYIIQKNYYSRIVI